MLKVCCQVGHKHFYMLFTTHFSKVENNPNLHLALKKKIIQQDLYLSASACSWIYTQTNKELFQKKPLYSFLVVIFSIQYTLILHSIKELD